MHYASIEDIGKSFGVRTLFQYITFHVEEGDKIALIARNGSGKTTLMKIVAGLESPDSGTVWVHKDIHTVFLPQESLFPANATIRDCVMELDHPSMSLIREYDEFVRTGHTKRSDPTSLLAEMDDRNAWGLETEIRQILGELQLHQLEQPVHRLSGGQKKRVALARALIEAGLHDGRCLLMLDEPTNHLDVSMIEWLEHHLSDRKITLILVTHDRYFMDAVCNEILEIDEEKVFVYRGDYEYFLEQKSLRQEVRQSEWLKDRNTFRRELEWMRKQPKARTTKSKSRQAAFQDIEEKVRRQKESAELTLQVNMSRLGGKVLEMKKVYKSYGTQQLLRGFDYTFKKGERIGIVGRNGTGKSTFLRIALQTEEPDSGKINHGETVVFGHFSQEGLVYEEDKRAIEWVKSLAEFFPLANGAKVSAAQFMERFGFQAEQQYTHLSQLSGGEKRRLHLLGVLFANPNFLVLDEPTNDMDLQTLRILEEFLIDYPGCLLMVSHDRYFMDRMVDHLFVFEGDGAIRDYPGNYTQYREFAAAQKQQAAETASAQTSAPARSAATAEKKNQKLSFREKNELDTLEKEMPRLQEEKQALEQRLGEPLPYDELNRISQRISDIIQTLDEMETRWLELSDRAN